VLDPVTGVELERLVTFTKPTRDLAGELLGNVAPGERRVSQQLSDFLLRCLELDPSRRISIADALKHPFVIAPSVPNRTGPTATWEEPHGAR
jgi:serine/threonine-protein kinase PRP4